MTESLEHFFTNKFTCTTDEISEVVKHFKYVEASKGEVLIEDGNVCRYLYFVIKGCLKANFIDANGQETIRYVAFENQLISSIHSFINQTSSNEYITVVEPSKLLAISYTDFKLELSKSSLFKDFYIKMLEITYLNNHWRIETFLRLDAKQRYDYLLKNDKRLVQRLSNKNLSHFLGITQESLSRIKAKK
ncbi:Crp/Fnr family transcriptional regulator [uncultured Winogradskyella sp.]|uniref:Crp/Fnr family transcriptional regulator n=1 Tax=uncultured Winogradskyella sp. TaxID=395353 RepID=UPI00262CC63E|nr:Crp/Fnr family transcriptional regulator [uncultured Winogradskyella sp.]|tara:strand:+ start:1880 stop:2449 length:570 start_codon:yes stop_codon:yes gene_type:complete